MLPWEKPKRKPASRRPAEVVDFLRWMSGWTVTETPGKGWLIANKMPAVQGEIPGESILFLRQAPRIWHAFYRELATGSATTPHSALTGGLGDAVSTDAQLRAYCRLVQAAPMGLTARFAGLSAAQSQCSADQEGMRERRKRRGPRTPWQGY